MFNLALFKRVISSAGLAGLLAGLLLTVVQQFQVIPLIHKAETYESAVTTEAPAAAHSHADSTEHHHHDESAWQPKDGAERTFYTAVANIAIALGFALIMGAAFSLKDDNIGLKKGLLWGLAGYIVFFLAPSLGLPPVVPGTEEAALQGRQEWWTLTVIVTAVSLAILFFAKPWWLKVLAIALLIIPHWIGAPQPVVALSSAPQEITSAFYPATALANAIFWIALGGLLGFFYKKLA